MKDRYTEINDRIKRACESVQRDPATVTLIAISKTHSIEKIQSLYDLGHRVFGESKLQEVEPKILALPKEIDWHFVGTLQSNKAKKISNLFSTIHTLTGYSQLKEIQKAERSVNGFIEVNIAAEPQKAGILAVDLDGLHKNLIEYVRFQFLGLMTIGPVVMNPEDSRIYFRELRSLNERLGGKFLSMGMSHDFEVAIQEGATHVRVGTALFGDR